MKIIDDFLTPEGLTFIKYKALVHQEPAEPFRSTDSELYKKCEAIFKTPCTNAMIWRVPSTTKVNPHLDSKKKSTVFYPFDSDGALILYNPDHTIRERIEVKENRMVILESGQVIHGQEPPTNGTRYSVAFHWAVSS